VPPQASVSLLQVQPGCAEQLDGLVFSKHALATPLQLGPVGSIQVHPGTAAHAVDVGCRHEGSVAVKQVPSVDHTQPRSATQELDVVLALQSPPAVPPRHVPKVAVCMLQPRIDEQSKL
jgi:hypothetical protein